MFSFRQFTTFFRVNLQSSLEYPGMLAIWMFDLFFIPFISLTVWQTIISQTPGLQNQGQAIINYYVFMPFIAIFTTAWQAVFFAAAVRNGSINARLVKPITPFLFDISNNLAEKVVKFFILLPIASISFFFFSVQPAFTLTSILLCFISIITSALLTFLVEMQIGLLAFWMDDISALENFVDIADYTLGGRLTPIFLFPPTLMAISHVLPFRYLTVFPLEILSNSLTLNEILTGFLIQSGWLLLFMLLSLILWKKGKARYSAYGG